MSIIQGDNLLSAEKNRNSICIETTEDLIKHAEWNQLVTMDTRVIHDRDPPYILVAHPYSILNLKL